MARRSLDQLCRSVLPAGYERVVRHGPQIQQFLDENLPEPVRHAVTLLTVDDAEIVLAANSPMVVNYLRLHAAEIEQQLRESLQLQQAVRFRTVPDDLLKIDRIVQSRSPRRVSAESIAAINNSAQWIDDETLRAALQSLADSLKPD